MVAEIGRQSERWRWDVEEAIQVRTNALFLMWPGQMEPS